MERKQAKMDQFREKVATYQQRVREFMDQARGWCTAHGLRVDEIPTHVLESYTPQYEARSMRILTADSDIPIAELLPTGSAIIGAQGRIDLKGRLARHAFLYQTGKGPGIGISWTKRSRRCPISCCARNIAAVLKQSR